MICLVTLSDINYENKVEGIILIADVVLQNQGYVRRKMTDDMEESFDNTGPGKIRKYYNFLY